MKNDSFKVLIIINYWVCCDPADDVSFWFDFGCTRIFAKCENHNYFGWKCIKDNENFGSNNG